MKYCKGEELRKETERDTIKKHREYMVNKLSFSNRPEKRINEFGRILSKRYASV